MKTFSITDVGMVRQVNQDYVYMTDNSLGPLPNLFVVADGMGGHQAGDYASKYTVEAFLMISLLAVLIAETSALSTSCSLVFSSSRFKTSTVYLEA